MGTIYQCAIDLKSSVYSQEHDQQNWLNHMRLCINPTCSNPENSDNELFCQACNTELLVKNNYYALRLLGEGGFGKTYELGGKGDRQVLKVLKKPSDKAVELFKREARFLQNNQTPGIPKAKAGAYFEHPDGENNSLHCLVMEKIIGQNLKDYIQNRGRPILDEVAKEWLVELSIILAEVHKQGILHRDIKPQNIIRQPDGTLALIDFGAVSDEALNDSSGTETASVVGSTETGTRVFTNAYAAPEQIEGQALPQSDIYSLGKTFIYLLTNKEPNDKSMYNALDNCVDWQPHTQGISIELAKLINLITAGKAKDRPSDAQALLKDIKYLGKRPKKGTDIGVCLEINESDAAIRKPQIISIERITNLEGTLKNEVAKLKVELPQNVKNGQKLCLKEAGNAGEYGGKAGDVFVKLKIIIDPEDKQYSEPEFGNTELELENTELDFQTFNTTQQNTDSKKEEDTSGCLGCLLLVAVVVILGGIGISLINSNSDDYRPTPYVESESKFEPSTPAGFPKEPCGHGGTSSWVLLRPRDGNLDTLLADVKNRLCSDAYLFPYKGEKWVRIAAFGDKQGAKEFASFIQPYIPDVDIKYTWLE